MSQLGLPTWGCAMIGSTQARLWVVLVANLALVGVLVVVGLAAHSLGVLAEGADYLGDAAGVGVALLAIRLAALPATSRRPHGYPRATRLAALVNAGWLLALCVVVGTGAIRRLVTGVPEVAGLPVLVVSGVAAVVMLGAALLLGANGALADDHHALNLRAVLLDTAADAAAAAGVATTGAVILISGGLYWLDPAVALFIAAVVGYHAARLLAQIARALRA